MVIGVKIIGLTGQTGAGKSTVARALEKIGYYHIDAALVAKEVINRTTGESYTYFYLNFLDKKREEYAKLVLNMTDPENEFADMHPEIKKIIDDAGFTTEELNQIWEIKKALKNRITKWQKEH